MSEEPHVPTRGNPETDALARRMARAMTYNVTVSAMLGGRRTSLHTFASALDEHDGSWFGLMQRSYRQRLQTQFRDRRRRRRDAPSQPALPSRRGAVVGELGADHVNLGDGLTPQGTNLAVVLEALRHHGRHRVDRDDLKVVFSQIGSQIVRVGDLTDAQREHALLALYTEIVRRCTTV